MHRFVRQRESLLELAVAELSAQIGLLVATLFVFSLLFHADDDITVIGELDLEVILGHARSSHFYFVRCFVLRYIDGWSRSLIFNGWHPVVIEEIVKQ